MATPPILHVPRLHQTIISGGVAIVGVNSNGVVSPVNLQPQADPIIAAFDDSDAAQTNFDNIQARTTAQSDIDTSKTALDKKIRAAAAVLIDEVNIIYAAMPRGITSITRSGNTATATTPTAHGMSNRQIAIFGAAQAAYNGLVNITVTGATTFTYTVAGTPTTPATGTILYVLDPTAPPLSRTLQQAYNSMKNKINSGSVD